MHGVATLYNCWVASSQYLSTHFFAWPSMPQDHEDIVSAWGFPEALIGSFSLGPAQILDSNIFLLLSTISLLVWHSRWVQPKYTWSRNHVGSSTSYSLLSTFHIGSMFCFFPASFISSTYTDKNSPFSLLTNKHSQFGTFSQPCSSRTFSNYLSHNSPVPEDDRTDSFREERLDHDFGHLYFGRRIHMSGHSDFGIVSNVGASSILTWV